MMLLTAATRVGLLLVRLRGNVSLGLREFSGGQPEGMSTSDTLLSLRLYGIPLQYVVVCCKFPTVLS